MTLNDLKNKAGSISDKTFGRENPKTGPIKKLMDEAEELLECMVLGQDPSEEFADCFLLLVDAYRKHFGDDVDMQKLIDDSSKKLDVVVGRKWGEPNEDGVFQHIDEEDIKLPSDEKIVSNPLELTFDLNEKKTPEDPRDFTGLDIDRIQKVYDEISLDFIYELTDTKTRKRIYTLLTDKLPEYDIKCNEENNPPEVVDNGQIWARVYHTDESTLTTNYIDLIF